jgi:hypothetical protein
MKTVAFNDPMFTNGMHWMLGTVATRGKVFSTDRLKLRIMQRDFGLQIFRSHQSVWLPNHAPIFFHSTETIQSKPTVTQTKASLLYKHLHCYLSEPVTKRYYITPLKLITFCVTDLVLADCIDLVAHINKWDWGLKTRSAICNVTMFTEILQPPSIRPTKVESKAVQYMPCRLLTSELDGV